MRIRLGALALTKLTSLIEKKIGGFHGYAVRRDLSSRKERLYEKRVYILKAEPLAR